MSDTDTTSLVTLANLCPLTNGNVVYQARALYELVFGPDIWADDNCSDSVVLTRYGNNQTITDGRKQAYRLYPDPSDGNISIRQSVVDNMPVRAEVWNSEGKNLYNDKLLFSNGSKNLNLRGITPGLYLLHLRDNYGSNYILKFIVN